MGALVCTRIGTPDAFGFSTSFCSLSSMVEGGDDRVKLRLSASAGDPGCTECDFRISRSRACSAFFFL